MNKTIPFAVSLTQISLSCMSRTSQSLWTLKRNGTLDCGCATIFQNLQHQTFQNVSEMPDGPFELSAARALVSWTRRFESSRLPQTAHHPRNMAFSPHQAPSWVIFRRAWPAKRCRASPKGWRLLRLAVTMAVRASAWWLAFVPLFPVSKSESPILNIQRLLFLLYLPSHLLLSSCHFSKHWMQMRCIVRLLQCNETPAIQRLPSRLELFVLSFCTPFILPFMLRVLRFEIWCEIRPAAARAESYPGTRDGLMPGSIRDMMENQMKLLLVILFLCFVDACEVPAATVWESLGCSRHLVFPILRC